MPVLLRTKGYRFEFYASDGTEPPHVHVKRNGGSAKFWLEPTVTIAYARRLKRNQVTEAMRLVGLHREAFLEAWHAFFG